MTLTEAIAVAAEAKPHRQPLDKLRGSRTTDLSAGVTALAKIGALGSTIAGMASRIDQLEADVEYLKTTFTPGSPIRRFHS